MRINIGAAPMHHDGTILSLHPLKREKTVSRRINGVFRLLGEKITLEQFCEEHDLAYPQDNQEFTPCLTG
ncbi:hypothetical protein H8S11_02990 [Flintibacter sp. NSJ-23]|uniref:Uncharacterized protein n=1 Tax=Flintibacter hominis TaxID=2763048 RepID=A0A8J6J794_9FIRM|nr:hypothetical protein [Flintibacter hominis]MBC5721785.1 hypothetical protein [Flintibacter hominis]